VGIIAVLFKTKIKLCIQERKKKTNKNSYKALKRISVSPLGCASLRIRGFPKSLSPLFFLYDFSVAGDHQFRGPVGKRT